MQPTGRLAATPTTLSSLDGMFGFLPNLEGQAERSIALIGTLPPRRCGIATFTADVQRSLRSLDGWKCDVIPIVDDAQAFEQRTGTSSIRQHEQQDYRRAADRINHLGYDIVSIQHEFGIFGGNDGAFILDLVERVTCPIVITMHTVIENPTMGQRLVVAALLRQVDQVIVMAQKGADILQEVFGADSKQISICPHGTPDRPLKPSNHFKSALNLDGRQVLLTFGLLSPGKGLETMISAMPEIIKHNPDALYLILGATHPNLKKQNGEAYRESLTDLVQELGVSGNVRFVDAFVEDDLLLDYLGASDIYVMPYANKSQVTSGTLAYAVALGKPVVSTPFWHATELIDDACGAFVEFGDANGFSNAINTYLCDPEKLSKASVAAYLKGRPTIWARSGEVYAEVFQKALDERGEPALYFPAIHTHVEPTLAAVSRTTDSCGILQHSSYSIDNRAHGYCIDDNVRALILIQRLRMLNHDSSELNRLERLYAAFIQHAWNSDTQHFRNFMGYDRSWREAVGSQDSNGRAYWALAETASHARDRDVRLWAVELLKQVSPSMATLDSLRATCFVALGSALLVQADATDKVARELLELCATNLMVRFETHARPSWQWLEPTLSYDNARLPQAMIAAGHVLKRPGLLAAGLQVLSWLDTIQKTPNGLFRAVGSLTSSTPFAPPTLFDQQPIEACATVDAALAAYEVTQQVKWLAIAKTAHAWFFGENDSGLLLCDTLGGCFDGLTPDGLNRNQGAESILALQMANAAMSRLRSSASVAQPQRLGIHM